MVRRKQITKFWILTLSTLGCLSFTACGRPPVLEIGGFENYVQRFEMKSQEAGNPVKVTELKIQFGDLEAAYEDGICELGDMTPTITVSKPSWDQMDDTEREILMFHEMGHCVLNRKHRSALDPKGLPESMMHPYGVPERIYAAARTEYIQELFLVR